MPPSEYKRLEELFAQKFEEHDAKSERRHMDAMKEIAHTNQNVHNISLSLLGNQSLGVDGIVKRVVDLENTDKSRKKREAFMFGVASATGLGSGGLFGWLFSLWK